MLGRLSTGFIAALAAAFAAAAQGGAVMEHYAAYNEAVAAGEVAAADTHGEAAWRAAEEAWGGTQQTAVLALNLATLRVTTERPAQALEPARRALELAEAGVLEGAANTHDVALLVGISEAASGDERRAQTRLRRALDARDDAGMPDTDISALAWLRAAHIAMTRNNLRDAAQCGLRAREAAAAAGGSYNDVAIQAALIEGASRLATGQHAESMDAFQHGHGLLPEGFGPAESRLEAEFHAWMAAVRVSDDMSEYSPSGVYSTTGSRLGRGRRELAETGDRTTPIESSSCGIWGDRTPPDYPDSDADRGRVGAAIVVYTLTPDGAVSEAYVAAEVPQRSEFGETALEGAQAWRFELVDAPPADCFEPRYAIFEFVFG